MNVKSNDSENVETIATFGSGKLVKTRAGAYRFDGGTRHDQLEALEWTALFFPEGVFAGNGGRR